MSEYSNEDLSQLQSQYKNLTPERFAEEAVRIATQQVMACSEFKKPRLTRIEKYWSLYNGDVRKKLRQLFNVPIPVFAGMVDTLNAQYDTPVTLDFKEADPSDFFKVQKIDAAFKMEVTDTAQTSKWTSKLRIARKHAIMTGRAILEYSVTSDPEYKSELEVRSLKDFYFQPRGGLWLENHLFAGTDAIERTKSDLIAGANAGVYNKDQVKLLLSRASDTQYLPPKSMEDLARSARFKPLGLDPENHTYVGESVFRLSSHILELDGHRWYVCFHPWTQTWLRFERWDHISSSDLFPWVSYATHEDDENFLSKSYADDLYPAADSIIALFNQELTNREKQNYHARAYDRDMVPDVRKLDEAQHRPDALIPIDTKNGTRRLSEAVYEFQVGELNGTVNLIDWIKGDLGTNTGATDMQMGNVQDSSKKASVAFAEQKTVSKRIGWASQPFQDMMAELGLRYINGLKDHMPAKMAIRRLGETGWDWDELVREELNTAKTPDVLVVSTEQQMQDSEIKAKRRTEALSMVDPMTVNPQWRTEQILSSVGEFSDEEVADALDIQTYSDRRAIAKASDAIQRILRDEQPDLWYGANIAFIQKIVDYASDKRSTLGEKFARLMDYAMAHKEIAQDNIERQIEEQASVASKQAAMQPAMLQKQAENPGMPGGMSRAMSIAESAV